MAKSKQKQADQAKTGFPPHLLKTLPSFSSGTVETLIPNAMFVMQNALTPSECKSWVKFADEDNGKKWDIVSHPATKYIAYRECGRIQHNDWKMSHRLYERIESMVSGISSQLDIFDKASLLHSNKQHTCLDNRGLNHAKYRPISCNPNLRLYKYTKGQWFGRHVDDSNKIKITPDAPSTISDAKETQTEITVLFYLSSCRGGATRFYLPGGKGKKHDTIAFTPEEGAVLLHIHGDHCLEHEAEPVLEGVKYG